jgi:catechol 2,3-dioxygenase
MPPTPKLHHINLKTTRLEELIEWYGTVVGLTPNFRYAGGAWLTNDDANHRIALLCVPGLSDDPDKIDHTGMHHTAFEYADLGELLDTYVRLKDDGITPHGCLDHGMTTSFYYADPDGNSVELQTDNFGDWQRSAEFMRSAPEFAADPIGVHIDPDRLVEARAQGASAEEIHRRGYAGEFTPPTPLDLRLPTPPETD